MQVNKTQLTRNSQIKEKIMPSEDLPGKLVISYEDTDFEVGFYIGDFYTEEMYQWHSVDRKSVV